MRSEPFGPMARLPASSDANTCRWLPTEADRQLFLEERKAFFTALGRQFEHRSSRCRRPSWKKLIMAIRWSPWHSPSISPRFRWSWPMVRATSGSGNTTLPQEENPVPLWTVFDLEGRVLGFVETPQGLDILQIGEDFILGRVKDEFEVEYVQVWALER